MTTTTEYLSLADFAADNSDDVAAIASRLPDAGTFICRGLDISTSLYVPEDPEGQTQLVITFQHEILMADPVNKDKDPESLVGRTIMERYTLWPKDFRELLGLLRGRYKRIGLPISGPNGGAEGIVGWLDGIVDWGYQVRVRHYTTKSGDERAGFDWKRVDDETAEAMGLVFDGAPGSETPQTEAVVSAE